MAVSTPARLTSVIAEFGLGNNLKAYTDADSGGKTGLGLAQFAGATVPAPSWSMGNFSSQSNKVRNSYYYSNTLTATVTNGPITLTAGGTSTYKRFRVNGGSLVTSASLATGTSTLRMRIRASSSYSSTKTGTIAGTGNTSSFSVTTGGGGGGGGGTTSCLSVNTPIMVGGIETTIGNLVAGNQVTSFNTPTMIDETDPTWETWTEDDISDGGNEITNVIRADAFLVGAYIRINGQVECTEPHPFLAQRDGLWQWIRAGVLEVGDNLYGQDGSAIPVTNIENITGQLEVMDVGAETVDNYFAGKIDGVYILNHNK